VDGIPPPPSAVLPRTMLGAGRASSAGGLGRAEHSARRAGATVTAPALAGMRWRMVDFDERTLAEGVVGADGVLTIPADQPVWLTELDRP